MAGNNDRVSPSLFDRLIDDDLSRNGSGATYSTGEMLNRVRRDLDYLLNSRRGYDDIIAVFDPLHYERAFHRFPELRATILGYGLPDLPSLRAIDGARRQRICALVKETIELFEPRLRNVKVSVTTPDEDIDRERTMGFHIEADCVFDRGYPVTFETKLMLNTGEYAKPSIKP